MRYYYTVQKAKDQDEYKLEQGKILGPTAEERQPDEGYEWKRVASSRFSPDDKEAVLSDLREQGILRNQNEPMPATTPSILDTAYMIRSRLG